MEGLLAQSDIYCERTDLTYWSEPVNAVTNLAFILAAWFMWRRTAGLPLGRALCVIVGVIGLSSYLWHTHATGWGGLADVASIAVFILVYLFVAHRVFWRLSLPWALVATAGIVPWMALTFPIFNALPFFEISNAYWPIATLILIYGVALRRRHPTVARGLLLGGGILVVSLILRSVDMALCAAWPMGTHWLWHSLNGIMLGWMIEVYRQSQAPRETRPS